MTEQVLQSPETVAFADLWYTTREMVEQSMPGKNDIPLREFARFMPNIALIDTNDAGRGKYILFGTGVVAVFGVDLTGHYFDEIMDLDTWTSHEVERKKFRDECGPDAIHGRWAIGRAHTNSGRLVEYEDLSLPYIEPSTGNTRHMVLLTLLAQLEFGEGVSARLPSQKFRWFDSALSRPEWLHQDESALS